MRPHQRGFTLIELLITLVFIALITVLVTGAVIGQIDQARGIALAAEARMVNTTAKAVLMEARLSGDTLSDEEAAVGLSGTAKAGEHWPAQVWMSDRMNALLAPDVVLAEEPVHGKARAVFGLRDGDIAWMTYEAAVSRRVYRVWIAEGQDAVVERVKGLRLTIEDEKWRFISMSARPSSGCASGAFST